MPPARFHALRDRVLAQVDQRFAERVLLSFLGADGRLDASRPSVEIEAPLRTGTKGAANMAGGFSQSWRTRLAAGKSQLHIDPVANPGIVLRPKDKVRALDRLGQPWFEVVHFDDRNHTRHIAELSEA
jgi:hypothetical protein